MDRQHKGWIALDIDGTVTDNVYSVPHAVTQYLKSLYEKGWQILFVSGRTFSFGSKTLSSIDFPYFFAVQNGADILEMPNKKLIKRNYLNKTIIPLIEKVYENAEEDFIIYAGFEKGDFCYFRPSRFSPSLLNFLRHLQGLCPEPWKEVNDFNVDELQDFPLLKCFGTYEDMKGTHEILKQVPDIHATLIRDPMCEGLYLILVTHKGASKGDALMSIVTQSKEKKGPIIAAGDDRNDISMLEKADISIVMETAPAEVLSKAHLIAASAAKEGIIQALELAICRI